MEVVFSHIGSVVTAYHNFRCWILLELGWARARVSGVVEFIVLSP